MDKKAVAKAIADCGAIQRSDLKRDNYRAYKAAYDGGFLDEFFPNKSRKKTEAEWKAEAKRFWGDRYDYGPVKWRGYSGSTARPVEIYCKKCRKNFKKLPVKHTGLGKQNQGCTHCARDNWSAWSKDSRDDFVRKAKQKHGNRYLYDDVEYVRSSAPVQIICRIHGPFPQRPDAHLRGSGCNSCAVARVSDSQRKGKAKFVEDAVAKHGLGTYSYGAVSYVNAHTKVEIECGKHGVFWQTPAHHVNQGNGCRQCGFKRSADYSRLSKAEFVDRASKIHKGRYSYTDVVYKNNATPVSIYCPEHGHFDSTPSNHLAGKGCPACGNRSAAEKQTMPFRIWQKRATEAHGGVYRYIQEHWNGLLNETKIICPRHGEFEQLARTHMLGCGCPDCGRLKQADSRRLTREEFLARAQKIHGKTYDYRLAHYTNNSTPVEIVCSKHGSFFQTPAHHFGGTGCPNCHFKSEARIKGFLEELGKEVIQQYMIGEKRYDFFLPDENLIIERDGEQHYTHVSLFAGDDEFFLERQQANDALKTKLAKAAGHRVARLPFWLSPDEELFELRNILDCRPSFADVPRPKDLLTLPAPNDF